ncbi:MAG: DUF6261 family protein [Marinifilaceae bacterium]
MNKQILTYCDAREVNNVATNILFEIQKKDWATDHAIQGILPRLEQENQQLTAVIGELRTGKYTQALQEADAAFDKDFTCLKQFVKANRFVQDKAIVDAADLVWDVIEAHDLNLHHKGYEKQLSLINSLLKDFSEEMIHQAIQKLYGVPENMVRLTDSTSRFQNLFRKSIEEGAAHDDSIAPTAQKKVVRDILNRELLPYLHAMAAVLPEDYAELTKVVSAFVESVNSKARARKKRRETVVES